MNQILKAFQQASQENQSTLVCLEGAVGSGKRDFLQFFFQKVRDRAFVCYAKFDKNGGPEGQGSGDPGCMFASELLTELLEQMASHRDATFWAERIRTHVGKEGWVAQIVASMAPEPFARLVDCEKCSNIEEASKEVCPGDSSHNANFDRVRYAVKSFFDLVSRYYPVVLVLDDLHWAHPHSLLLAAFLQEQSEHRHHLQRLTYVEDTQREPLKLLTVVSYEPMAPSHPIYRLLFRNQIASASNIETHEDSTKLYQKIILLPLSVDDVANAMSRILRRDRHDVQSLAVIIHQRTNGDYLFIKEFVKMLKRKSLFTYSTTNFQWEWDEDKIRLQTDLSENVVDMVLQSLKALPENVQMILLSAALLGALKFQSDFLLLVLHTVKKTLQAEGLIQSPCAFLNVQSIEDVEEMLQPAIEDALVEKLATPHMYKFTHERVREAAEALLPRSEVNHRIWFEIGRACEHNLAGQEKRGEDSDPQMVIMAARFLTVGSEFITEQNARLNLARLNLQAGAIARYLMAFQSAFFFHKSSLKMLELSSGWDGDYDLMLEVSCSLAQIELTCGLYQECRQTTENILANARNVGDKRIAYNILVSSMMHLGHYDEALERCHGILSGLGFPMPRRSHGVCIWLLNKKVEALLHGKTDNELVNLACEKKLNHELHIAVDLILRMGNLGVLSGRNSYLMLSALRSLELVLLHGCHRDLGFVFAEYGRIRQYVGKFDDATRFGNLALQVADTGQDSALSLFATVINRVYVSHWHEPFYKSLRPLAEAQRKLMQHSDVEFAHVWGCVNGYTQFYLGCGLQLDELEKDMRKYARAAHDSGQAIYARLFEPWLLYVRNLMGLDKSLLQEALSAKELVCSGRAKAQCKRTMLMTRMAVAYYFSNLSAASIWAKRLKAQGREDTAPMDVVAVFLSGMVAAASWQSKNRSSDRHEAVSILRKLEKWVRKGNANCLHMAQLLRAELMPLKSPVEDKQAAYDNAIVSAGKLGFLHDQALANERAGVFFLLKRGDCKWASTYLSRAQVLYKDWGARAIAAHMEDFYSDYLDQSHSITTTSSSGLYAKSVLEFHDFQHDELALYW